MKRILDVIIAGSALLLLSPLMIFLAYRIKRELGSPVVFHQTRAGLNSQSFKLHKFRSMSDATDDKGELLPDVDRLTAFGMKLRASSLDELPTLWNVLCGDMSIVGPRPLFPEYVPLYSSEQSRRHDVRPGVTGWAQINGRNSISWEDKFKLDVWYVDNQSIVLDLKIIYLTFSKVLSRQGVTAEGDVSMPRFTGSPSDRS